MEFFNDNKFRAYPFRKDTKRPWVHDSAIVECGIVIEGQTYTSEVPCKLHELIVGVSSITAIFTYDSQVVAEFIIPFGASDYSMWFSGQSFIVISDIGSLIRNQVFEDDEWLLLPSAVSFFNLGITSIGIYTKNISPSINDVPPAERYPNLINLDSGYTLEETVVFENTPVFNLVSSNSVQLGVLKATNSLALINNIADCPTPEPQANTKLFFNLHGVNAEHIIIESAANVIDIDATVIEVIRNPASGDGDVICRT